MFRTVQRTRPVRWSRVLAERHCQALGTRFGGRTPSPCRRVPAPQGQPLSQREGRVGRAVRAERSGAWRIGHSGEGGCHGTTSRRVRPTTGASAAGQPFRPPPLLARPLEAHVRQDLLPLLNQAEVAVQVQCLEEEVEAIVLRVLAVGGRHHPLLQLTVVHRLGIDPDRLRVVRPNLDY